MFKNKCLKLIIINGLYFIQTNNKKYIKKRKKFVKYNLKRKSVLRTGQCQKLRWIESYTTNLLCIYARRRGRLITAFPDQIYSLSERGGNYQKGSDQVYRVATSMRILRNLGTWKLRASKQTNAGTRGVRRQQHVVATMGYLPRQPAGGPIFRNQQGHARMTLLRACLAGHIGSLKNTTFRKEKEKLPFNAIHSFTRGRRRKQTVWKKAWEKDKTTLLWMPNLCRPPIYTANHQKINPLPRDRDACMDTFTPFVHRAFRARMAVYLLSCRISYDYIFIQTYRHTYTFTYSFFLSFF